MLTGRGEACSKMESEASPQRHLLSSSCRKQDENRCIKRKCASINNCMEEGRGTGRSGSAWAKPMMLSSDQACVSLSPHPTWHMGLACREAEAETCCGLGAVVWVGGGLPSWPQGCHLGKVS